MDRFILFALVATAEAVAQAAWTPSDAHSLERTATVIASGIGGFPAIVEAVRTTDQRGVRRLSPFTVPSFLANLAAGHISIRYGFKGPIGTPVTACAASVQAIGDAARLIRTGEADVAICGGSEACIDLVSLGGFAAARALSTGFNETPARASRPFDRDRDGFVMGEGAAVLILEELEHAKARGAKVICEVVGYANRGNAYHMTGLRPDGLEMAEAITDAMEQGGIKPEDIHYINAHGSGTKQNDRHETAAYKKSLGQQAYKIPISSIKSMVGHSLGGIGAIEMAACALAIDRGVIPPTANWENRDPECDLDYTPVKARKQKVDVALSTASGFGGFQSAMIFGRPKESR